MLFLSATILHYIVLVLRFLWRYSWSGKSNYFNLLFFLIGLHLYYRANEKSLPTRKTAGIFYTGQKRKKNGHQTALETSVIIGQIGQYCGCYAESGCLQDWFQWANNCIKRFMPARIVKHDKSDIVPRILKQRSFSKACIGKNFEVISFYGWQYDEIWLASSFS